MESASINRAARKRKKKKSRLISIRFLIILILAFIALSNYLITHMIFKSNNYNYKISEDIHSFLTNSQNRIDAYDRAVSLNGGASANTCVYFISEVLRMNGEKIDQSICNTSQLLDIMKKEGWKVDRDYKNLKPGDICFTTDEALNKGGIPTHTYVFMGWKNPGRYDYAYICDNQAKDYNGKVYHIRNITKVETVKGNVKEPFSFFMYRRK